MARRKARELAFRTLFQSERGSMPLSDVWEAVREELGAQTVEDAEEAYGDVLDETGIRFAESLLKSFEENREAVDAQLKGAIEGWDFAQMAQTDLTVLRLAATEFLYTETPREVAIESAVRIAKKFGSEESGRFVNGVLARLYTQLKNAQALG